MPYDLYGQYYASQRDANNAEMSQCAAIDADIAYREIEQLKRQMNQQQQPSQLDEDIYYMKQHIDYLQSEVTRLSNRYAMRHNIQQ